MKRAALVLFSCALVLSMWLPLPAQAAIFPDVPNGHWAQNDIEELANKGIISGKPNGRFDPNGHVTRGQFALMLYRALKLPDGRASFRDVPSDTLLGKAVGAIVNQGIANGYPDKTFKPNQPITRGQMAVMITRVLGLEDAAIANKQAMLPYTDRFVETQRGYIKVVSDLGLIRGVSATQFAAGNPATRAQTAVILNRMLKRDPSEQPTPSSVIDYTIPNLTKGLVEWYSTSYYANPMGNDKWIIWIQEEKNFDRSLPKPNAKKDSDLRQAIFGWYNLETGQISTMKLDYLYDTRPTISPPALGIYKDVALIEIGLENPDLVSPHVILVDLKQGKTERLDDFFNFNQNGYFLYMEDSYLNKLNGKYLNIEDRSLFTIEGFDLKASKNWLAWYRLNSEKKELDLIIQKRNMLNDKPQVIDHIDTARSFNITDKWLVYSKPLENSIIAYNLDTGEKNFYPNETYYATTVIDDYLILFSRQKGFDIYQLLSNEKTTINLVPEFWNTFTSDEGRPYLFWYKGNSLNLYDLEAKSLKQYELPFSLSTKSEQMQAVSITTIYKQHVFGWADSHILKIPLEEFKTVQ